MTLIPFYFPRLSLVYYYLVLTLIFLFGPTFIDTVIGYIEVRRRKVKYLKAAMLFFTLAVILGVLLIKII